MNEKKMFGLGAVVLLLLMSLSPAANSINVKTNKNDSFEKDVETENGRSDCDLEVTIDSCKLKYIYLKGGWSEPIFTIYEIFYTITNHNNPYAGDVRIVFNTIEILNNTYSFNEVKTVNLESSESIKFDHEILVHTSWDANDDEERYVAGKFFSLEIEPLNADDIYLENNIDYGKVKFWLDRSNYEPTASEILVASQHNYMNISIGDSGLWYYETPFNPDDFSDIFIKNRLGYVWELGIFIYKINTLIKKILIDFIDFSISVSDDVKIVLYWLNEVFIWTASIVAGTPLALGILQLLNDFIMFVRPALDEIKDEANSWGEQELNNTIIELLDVMDDFENWIEAEPWKNDINIEIKVKTKNEDDTITVNCREEACCKTGETEYEFDFNVPSKIDGELVNWTIKDCTVKVSSLNLEKSKHSWKVLSWAFANGTMRVIMPFDFTFKEKNKINDMHRLMESPLIERLLKRNIVFRNLFIKIFSFSNKFPRLII